MDLSSPFHTATHRQMSESDRPAPAKAPLTLSPGIGQIEILPSSPSFPFFVDVLFQLHNGASAVRI